MIIKNIAYFLLFYLACPIILFVLSSITNFSQVDIFEVWWQMSFFYVLLLSVIFVSEKTTNKKHGGSSKYYPKKNHSLRQIKSNIWCRIYSCFFKFLQIHNGVSISHNIRDTNNTTNNHALHGDNLSQDNQDVNQNGTLPL